MILLNDHGSSYDFSGIPLFSTQYYLADDHPEQDDGEQNNHLIADADMLNPILYQNFSRDDF